MYNLHNYKRKLSLGNNKTTLIDIKLNQNNSKKNVETINTGCGKELREFKEAYQRWQQKSKY